MAKNKGRGKADFTQATIRALRDRVSGLCAFPGCRIQTLAASDTNPSSASNIGEAAHIKSAAAGGPRYDDTQTDEQRRDISNGVWMCVNHARMIDRDECRYTIEQITAWKLEAEAAAQSNHGRRLYSENDHQQALIASHTGHGQPPSMIFNAITNAHAASAAHLESLDPRIQVRTTYLEDKIELSLHAKETFSVQYQIHDPNKSVIQDFNAMMRHGTEITMPSECLTIKGSPLLESISSMPGGKVTITTVPSPAELYFELVDPATGLVTSTSVFQGSIVKGSESYTFTGGAFNNTVTMVLSGGFDDLNRAQVNISHRLEHWEGKALGTLPYFDQLHLFYDSLSQNMQVKLSLNKEGITLLDSTQAHYIKQDRYIEEMASFLSYTKACSTIAAALKERIFLHLDHTYTKEEHGRVLELAKMASGNYQLKAKDLSTNPTLKLTVNSEAFLELLRNPSSDFFHDFVIKDKEGNIDLFGQPIALPPLSHKFSGADLSMDTTDIKVGDTLDIEFRPRKDFLLEVTFAENG